MRLITREYGISKMMIETYEDCLGNKRLSVYEINCTTRMYNLNLHTILMPCSINFTASVEVNIFDTFHMFAYVLHFHKLLLLYMYGISAI